MQTATKTIDPVERQRMDALAAANETRLNRAAMKRKIKAGRLRIERVIMDPPWYAESMYVMELLTALPRYGRARAQKRMIAAELPLAKRVGTMTERQRRVLAEVMAAS